MGMLKSKDKKDLILVIFLVVLSVVVISAPPLNDTPIRAVVGFPIVFFLPGYSLVASLFPRDEGLDMLEKIALSIGLSICIVGLTGILLNFTPWGLKLGPVLLTLSTFTLFFVALGAIRRGK